MFERYLTDAVTKHLGHLVDVDTEKVRLSAWNGRLVLQDVNLRPDALDGFVDQCPVELAYGKVGRLDIQVPWGLVGSQLWKRRTTKTTPAEEGQHQSKQESVNNVSITLSDVNILITPRRRRKSDDNIQSSGSPGKEIVDGEVDEDKVQRKARERKEKVVQEMLDAQLLSRVALSSQASSRWKWVQDWLSELLSSLTITARNIHIRYEDPGHSMGFVWNPASSTRIRRYRKTFAIGITLGDFLVKATDRKLAMNDIVEENSGKASGDVPMDEDSTKSEIISEVSTESSIPEKQFEQCDGSNEEEAAPNVYTVRSKVAAAKKLAIYWDTDGCFLMSQGVQANQNTRPLQQERIYFECAFSILNNKDSKTTAMSTFTDREHYQTSHTYLLDPVSPLARFDFASSPNQLNHSLPTSSVNVSLPPTLFFVSRQTLEDTAYLRKSLDAWMHAKKGILSDRSLRRLASLRPLQSAVENPRRWWKYAAEATIAFIQIGRQQDSIHRESNITDNERKEVSQKRGWIGLARALGKRRQYVALYNELYKCEKTTEEETDVVFGPEFPLQQRVHHSLLELEDELSATEIVAFRIAAHKQVVGDAHGNLSVDDAITNKLQAPEIGNSDLSPDSTPEFLSCEHRCYMFAEMGEALERERLNTALREQEEGGNVGVPETETHLDSSPSPELENDPAVWKISLSCAQLSLQVNDRCQTRPRSGSPRPGSVPIVRVSCVCLLETDLYASSSWEINAVVAALTMEDLQEKPELDKYQMRTLLGPKASGNQLASETAVDVDGTSFQESLRIAIRRNHTPGQIESTTYTRIRLAPMEIIYSTVPFEALTRVLATIKTPELADDYHRMAGRVHEWREKQKRRLLQALAHRGKIMVIDVDVTAPVLLIPETLGQAESPLLVIDLGQLNFSNEAKTKEDTMDASEENGFDDAWKLILKNIQMQCSTTKAYRTGDSVPKAAEKVLRSHHQLLESFSLEMSILTLVAGEGAETRFKIAARLPRLSFNITSSSLRLINRLRSQWSRRKRELTTDAFSSERTLPTVSKGDPNKAAPKIVSPSAASSGQGSKNVKRYFEFDFSAPFIKVNLENDSEARIIPHEWASPAFSPESTPILSLSFMGIGGRLVQKRDMSGSAATHLEARLHSLLAVDHYQTAGSAFSLLLSSLEPTGVANNAWFQKELLGNMSADENHTALPLPFGGKDVVFVEYTSMEEEDSSLSEINVDKLSIQFHELYVEWNPETLAALQKAVRTPREVGAMEDESTTSISKEETLSDDEFYDAEEEFFFDSNSVTSAALSSPDIARTPLKHFNRESRKSLLSPQRVPMEPFIITKPPSRKQFEVVFNLSKLRVSFNKESRHRHLIFAEMDRTFIRYQTQPSGGSKTVTRLGNLIVSDPSSTESQTLYGQILGLQNDALGKSSPELSLFEMEIVSNPKLRQQIHPTERSDYQSVSINYGNGSVRGSDTHITARLSPMRFVYLSQLWSEIVDYLFEGVMGYEVLGKERPVLPSSIEPNTSDNLNQIDCQHAVDDDSNLVSFTKFDITIDSPVVLFPVTYRSPQLLKLTAAGIKVTNFFECNRRSGDVSRWHNNCNVSFRSLRIFSWDGKELSHSEKNTRADIHLRWPVGPLAKKEFPKWNVACKLDSLDFTFRRDDYALLQNVVNHNVSEESRNLDEWNALQNLSADELKLYRQSIMVHYGYDSKDVAPTTYSIMLEMPLVSVALEAGNGATVAIATCSNFLWKMRKGRKRVSRQEITCNIEMAHPRADSLTQMLLSFNQSLQPQGQSTPELNYSSTSDPAGNNVKTLDITNARINMFYPGWMEFSKFFSDLPEIEILTAEEVGLSVQVGDRWYKIAKTTDNKDYTEKAKPTGQRSYSWIGREDTDNVTEKKQKKEAGQASFQLRILLSSPCIVLPSVSAETEGETNSVILRLRHLDFLHNAVAGKTTKSFFLHDLELNTSSQSHHGAVENSLIHPWCVAGTSTACNEKSCSCDVHTFRVSAGVLRARAAFSDMMIAINVGLQVVSDIRQSKAKESAAPIAKGVDSLQIAADIDARNAENSVLKSKQQALSGSWEGFEFLVVDDSGRHFAGSQELITLSLGKMQLWREVNNNDLRHSRTNQKDNICTYRLTARLEKLDILDCLQPEQSPFRYVACIRSENSANGDDEHTECQCGLMIWKDFSMTQSEKWGFSPSPTLIERTTLCPFPIDAFMDSTKRVTPSITLDSFEDDNSSQAFALTVGICKFQYNPSTVIALQRFGGRFRKQATASMDAFNDEFDKLMEQSYGGDATGIEEVSAPSKVKVRMTAQAKELSVDLNKEHQHRRLLRLALSDCKATMRKHRKSLVLDGSVGDFCAWDCDINWHTADEKKNANNLCVVRALRGEHSQSRTDADFMQFRYRLNPNSLEDHEIPNWVRAHVATTEDSSQDMDDCLEVTVGTVEFTYLRERTAEWIDYLSNGLPGKGMGATSKAAQGFLQKRIQTKSFLHILIQSPSVLIPQNKLATAGIRLQLGDIDLSSWFEGGSSKGRIEEIDLDSGASALRSPRPSSKSVDDNPTDWWRMLSLNISDFSAGIFEHKNNDSLRYINFLKQPLALSLILQKSAWHHKALTVRCNVSLVDMTLRYSHYCRMHSVMQGNLGREIDTGKWNNIEKAYDREVKEAEARLSKPAVEYASGARHVRFGNMPQDGISDSQLEDNANKVEKKSLVDVKFELDGFALKFRRNDPVESASDQGEVHEYDMILLKVHMVDISVSNSVAGDYSFQLALYRIGVFDLGDRGRLDREKLTLAADKRREMRRPCAFSVLVEGYSSAAEENLAEENQNRDMQPQFLITVDKVPASSVGAIGSPEHPMHRLDRSSTVTVVTCMLNYLSVNALIRPLTELGAFLAIAWPDPSIHGGQGNIADEETETPAGVSTSTSGESVLKQQYGDSSPVEKIESKTNSVQFKLVANYPKIYFVAEEQDAHSRALVLRGLTVVNAERTIRTEADNDTNLGVNREDTQSNLVVHAQLQRLESYINADVSRALGLQKRHRYLLDEFEALSHVFPSEDSGDNQNDDADDLGIALLQPVTTGLEFGRTSRSRFPSRRFLCVNVEPISTMLSFDDLQLIESVLNKWVWKPSDVTRSNPGDSGDSKTVDPDQRHSPGSKWALHFKTGVPNGISIEKSSVAGIPVVTSVQTCISLAILGGGTPEHRFPRIGALLTELNGKNLVDVECLDAIRLVTDNGVIAGDTSQDSHSSYSLTFMEIEGQWGMHDSFDLSLQGAVLTFIDDLNGRDMPMVRGTLKAAEIHLRKGIGVDTCDLGPLEKLSILTDGFSCADIAADGSVALRAYAKMTIDYFHPRNATYEPLLEPAQFVLSYECHSENIATGRPGQVALQVSDHLLQNRETETSGTDYQPQLVAVNISDASVEVLAKALREWETWRKMVKESYSMPTVSLVTSDLHESLTSAERSMGSAAMEAIPRRNQAVASSAAQAAFLFAQRRGADKSGNSDSSKPFVFRNRTGVSIAFAQQDVTRESKLSRKGRKLQPQQSFVGEYAGLEHFDRALVTELADGDDELFQMNVLGHNEAKTKVRTYHGQLPCLTVAIQAVAGVTVEAISDLQVQKAGCSIRHLPVQRLNIPENSRSAPSHDGSITHSVPLVWRIEVVDNRRILTLSSAVQIVSLNSTVGIEVGIQRVEWPQTPCSGHETDTSVDKAGSETAEDPSSENAKTGIQLIGAATPGSPYYLPIWLAMRREQVSVFVRPRFDGPSARYSWGHQRVLKFGEWETDSISSATDWAWQGSLDEGQSNSIRCQAIGESAPTAFLSSFSSSQIPNQNRSSRVDNIDVFGREEVATEILSVSIDSGLSLRNLLPVALEWEAAHSYGPEMLSPVDGSTVRFEENASETSALKSGECADVYACNFKLESLKIRFKLNNMSGWSEWAVVSSPTKTPSLPSEVDQEDSPDHTGNLSPFQTNVQISDAFGVPVTVGVRVNPKMAKAEVNESNAICYGVDVVLYAELWISNLTSLPLTFGCPERQIFGKAGDSADNQDEEEATKFSAEAALMEMASVLEVGSKGTQMDTRTADKAATAGEVYILPHQQNSLITEEIFEFIEIDSSTISRRWWASESYWNLRNSEVLDIVDTSKSWHWIDEEWKIDHTGPVEISAGWESCKDLLGGEGPFSGRRTFFPSDRFRRRRWFRSRAANYSNDLESRSLVDQDGYKGSGPSLLLGLQAFHHPICDSFSRSQQKANKRKKRRSSKTSEFENESARIELASANTYKIAIKCGDGKWSESLSVTSLGTNHGNVRVFASRWPKLTRSAGGGQQILPVDSSTLPKYGVAPLNPALYELVYQVVEVEGEWGEFSRHMMVSPRFSVRNDSKQVSMEFKQAGTSDGSAIRLSPGEVAPFYWSDCRLPRLACLRPTNANKDEQRCYKWSGGFDPHTLGMTALLIRRTTTASSSETVDTETLIRSIRTLVELRPGTGGNGFNISFKEESEDGDGALFRVENSSPFNIWISQDGVLANPSATVPHTTSEQDGDLIQPGGKIAFGLEVPYRQGKYAHRKAATMTELLRVRIGLAPLSSRAGIETTKVMGLSVIGESTRLKPSKLVTILSPDRRKTLEMVRILAVTTIDGPSRVLKFCLMAYPQVDNLLGNSLMESVSYAPPIDLMPTGPHVHEIEKAASATEEMLIEKQVPNEIEAKRRALFGGSDKPTPLKQPGTATDKHFSIRVSFSGFVFSLIDSSPSEICTIAVDNINAVAKWHQASKTLDSSFLMSIGWLQVDNHIPSAPFPVAVCPEGDEAYQGSDNVVNPTSETQPSTVPPLLFLGVEIAPKHSSGIVCLKSITVAPRSMAISLDLAFLVRLQRYASGLQMHFQPQRVSSVEVAQKCRAAHQLLYKRAIPTPDVQKRIQQVKETANSNIGRQQVFFGALAVLPFTIKLSVAPARALTPAQAAFEGAEAAAIHKAVRKGDFFVGRTTHPLGVVVGRKNKTALAVVQGVFKSIVVDALIRMDGASLNLAGAFLRNQIFYGPQLATYLAAHYLFSMKQNVPALLGSMAAFGNPLGLFRGIGDGVNDFVNEPMKGIKKSIAKLDPKYLVDGVARGTGSLARHTVGGVADSAALLTSTFSKNMAVLTLDRRYAQKRDRGNSLQSEEPGDFLFLDGLESGFVKLAQGFIEGVTGVVKAPMRGAERSGFEGFAKGLGKGLLGLLVKVRMFTREKDLPSLLLNFQNFFGYRVKPMIGISDAATDVFIGVKSSVEGDGHHVVDQRQQVRLRRAFYGWERQLRQYNLADAAACALMLRSCIGGQSFLSHLDMDDRVALLSDKRLLLLDSEGQKLLLVKFKHVSNVEVRQFGQNQWTVLIMLNTPCKNGSEVEVVNSCKDQAEAQELCNQIKHAMSLLESQV